MAIIISRFLQCIVKLQVIVIVLVIPSDSVRISTTVHLEN